MEKEESTYGVIGMLDRFRDPRACDFAAEGDASCCPGDFFVWEILSNASRRNCSLFIIMISH